MIVATVIVQGVLVEADCLGVVSELSSMSFVILVVLEDFRMVLWSSWKIVLWCRNEREDFLGPFSLMLVGWQGTCLWQ